MLRRERLRVVENELERIRGESATLKERWNREKAAISRVRELKEAQDKARQEEERATRAGDWEKAAQLQYGSLAQIEKDLEAATKELEAIKAAQPLCSRKKSTKKISRAS